MVVVLACSAVAGLAQPRPVTLSQWRADLVQARSLADEAVAPDPNRMQQIATLTGPVVLEVHDATVSLPADAIIDGLQGQDQADFQQAARRLDALLREADDLAATTVAPRAAIAADLEDIYREVNPELTLLQRLERLLSDLVSRIATSVATRPALAILLLLLVAAGGVALAVWVGRRAGLVGDAVVADDLALATHADWLAEAERARRAGDTDRAVRAAYRALVAALGERGVVDPRPSLTAAECRRSVRATAPDLDPAVTAATTAYEQVVYAGRDAADDDVDRLLAAHGAARDRSGRRPRSRR